jgi:hypothetical protein
MVLKGQGAAEYVILLAMVLIVGLIAIILIGGFAEVGGEGMDSESKTYWNGPVRPFSIVQWAQQNNTLYMEVKNKETARLVLTNISVGNSSANLGAGWSFGPGAAKTITVSDLPQCDQISYDIYAYDVTFTYNTEDITGTKQIGSKKIAGKCTFD